MLLVRVASNPRTLHWASRVVRTRLLGCCLRRLRPCPGFARALQSFGRRYCMILSILYCHSVYQRCDSAQRVCLSVILTTGRARPRGARGATSERGQLEASTGMRYLQSDSLTAEGKSLTNQILPLGLHQCRCRCRLSGVGLARQGRKFINTTRRGLHKAPLREWKRVAGRTVYLLSFLASEPHWAITSVMTAKAQLGAQQVRAHTALSLSCNTHTKLQLALRVHFQKRAPDLWWGVPSCSPGCGGAGYLKPTA